jgi:hypothetical protein
VPCAPVLTLHEAMAHPHLRQRGTVRRVRDATIGEFDIPGLPVKFSRWAGQSEIAAALRWQIPQNFQGGGAYLMNQFTWALCTTMSDANGRPIMTITPGDAVPSRIGGAPVIIATQMPDVVPGSTPVGEPQGRDDAARPI